MDCLESWISPTGIGAIANTIVVVLAFWFGFFGNRAFRHIVEQHEKITDKKAFEYLTNAPQNLDSKIDQSFEKDILELPISNKKIKEYRKYIDIVKKFHETCDYTNERDQIKLKENKKYFEKIKTGANKLKKVVDEQTWQDSMQKIYWYEAVCFWNRNIICFEITNIDATLYSLLNPRVLVYSDWFVDEQNKSYEIVGKIINNNELLRRRYEISEIDIKNQIESFSSFLPKTHYTLLNPNKSISAPDRIKIRYREEEITLEYKQAVYITA